MSLGLALLELFTHLHFGEVIPVDSSWASCQTYTRALCLVAAVSPHTILRSHVLINELKTVELGGCLTDAIGVPA